MKRPQIFPKEIMENSNEVHQFSHRSRSKAVYALILIFVVTILTLLPFIKIDIFTSARGIIKADKERISINSIISGKVIKSNLELNSLVQEGDTIIVLDNSVNNEKLDLSKQKIEELNLFISDLKYLLGAHHIDVKKIHTSKYKAEYLFYEQKRQELKTRLRKSKQDYDRNTRLYDKEVITKIEFESSKYDFDLALNQVFRMRKQQILSWETSRAQYESELIELTSQEKQLIKNQSQFVITSPVTGNLLNTKGIEIGSYLNSGDLISDISPNSNLIVECLISTQDIGLLNPKSEVIFQIDAYNYNQWGFASGEVIDISNDIEIINNTAVYKLKCSLHNLTLKLKNGFTGELKKGMTLTAQFKLAERSLFDLLYDKLDDWMNPGQNEITSQLY